MFSVRSEGEKARKEEDEVIMAGLSELLVNLFYKSATGTKRVRTTLTILGGVFFLTIVLLTIYIAIKMDRLLELPELFSMPWNIVVSLPFIVGGVCLWLWSVRQFIKAKGTPAPFNPPPKLITTGPYTYARNPMLAGVFLMLFGLGVFLRSISLTFIFTPIFIFFSILEFKLIEEPELEKRLGTEYIEYKKTTPLLIPKKIRRLG